MKIRRDNAGHDGHFNAVMLHFLSVERATYLGDLKGIFISLNNHNQTLELPKGPSLIRPKTR